MKFSQLVKTEILSALPDMPCCQLAYASAMVRSCGYIVSLNGQVGFELSSDKQDVIDYVDSLLFKMYNTNLTKVDNLNNKQKSNRLLYSCVNDKSLNILVDMGIITIDEMGQPMLVFGINEYLTENDCCKISYMKGCFVGSGSITMPHTEANSRTGYHMEFIFNNYQPATDFCELCSELYILTKLTARKDKYIVYIKTSEQILSVLELFNSNKSIDELITIIEQKQFNNDENRAMNCEISNMTKQMDASIKCIQAIKTIDQTVGLNALPETLLDVAIARQTNQLMPLSQLANILGISKSCLNHRIRRIIEISNNIM